MTTCKTTTLHRNRSNKNQTMIMFFASFLQQSHRTMTLHKSWTPLLLVQSKFETEIKEKLFSQYFYHQLKINLNVFTLAERLQIISSIKGRDELFFACTTKKKEKLSLCHPSSSYMAHLEKENVDKKYFARPLPVEVKSRRFKCH